MGKQILLVTGSPRLKGNSMRMADAFSIGAIEAGHAVSRLDAALHSIGGCRACGGCQSKDAPCVLNDGFNELLAPRLLEADCIVFCAPLYFFGLPSQIKAAIDRMYCLLPDKGGQAMRAKESALMLCGADEGEAPYAGAIEAYRQICAYMGWKDKGVLIVPGVSEPGDILQTDGLVRAREFGKL